MASLRDRFVAAYRAFREPQLLTEPLDSEEFAAFEARKNRYAILWSFYENSVYSSVHDWAHTYKVRFGLYRYIRNIYNPANRLGTFWRTHLMGGLLDPAAGDGERVPSALPIEAGEDLSEAQAEALRAAIAQVWKWSNWHIYKDVLTLWGSVFGDVGLEVVDDAERGRVYLRVVNPSLIKDVTLDAYGNVKAYTFEEKRVHPENRNQSATYREEASRSGDNVVYRTYLNGQPYGWPGQEDGQGQRRAEWQEPYGFIPLVMVQHNNVGLDWGWSEMHAGRPKFQEVDDLASKLHDQIRKMVEGAWLFAGVDKPSSTPSMTSRDSETYQTTSSAVNRPQPGREEMPALYGPAGADAKSLVTPLDIAAVGAEINRNLEELERDYPELQMDIWTSSGEASGRALRVARQRAESKVRMRRVAYDDALVRAQQMAVSIGAQKKYDGFEGFTAESYERGDLAHSIAKRAVFAADPLDDIEIEMAEWKTVLEAAKAGIPLEFYLLEEKGWDEEKIARLTATMEAQMVRGVEQPSPWMLEEAEQEEKAGG